jgi:dihydrofolate reductase
MLTGPALNAALGRLASSATRPKAYNMVRATLAQHWQDPLAKKRTLWPRARYNITGGAQVLYVGDDYLTAAAETLVAVVPTWIVAFATVHCNLNAVLDLTDVAVQAALATNNAELSKNFRAFPRSAPPTETQVLGEAAAASGNFDGRGCATSRRPELAHQYRSCGVGNAQRSVRARRQRVSSRIWKENTLGLLTFSINVTLDGCVDHQEGIADDETHALFTRLLDESGAMLWGRVTYEMMEGYWPAVARGDVQAPPALREWAVTLEAKPKYVVSSTRKDFTWAGSHLITGDLRTGVQQLKDATPAGVLLGSGKLATELDRLDLIDEYKFLVHPRIVGHGPTLYQGGLPSTRRLELVSATPLRCGAVVMHYRRAR